ncbi:hypothetical protein ACFSL6_08940 [Paenibacillus thailandensis]|uniref:DUF3168 domain-containing protein n=1 Tax=Paenibacillus thailandensis TaxID=393250 RepID=A0ABW5QSZ6_9BACL
MFDAKKIIGDELSSIEGVHVSDFYPSDFSKLPHIAFYEQSNREGQPAIPGVLTEIVFQIDIWHDRSTGPIAQVVNEKMNEMGLRRDLSADLPDPSGLKRKTMRFRGIVDSRTNLVYQ